MFRSTAVVIAVVAAALLTALLLPHGADDAGEGVPARSIGAGESAGQTADAGKAAELGPRVAALEVRVNALRMELETLAARPDGREDAAPANRRLTPVPVESQIPAVVPAPGAMASPPALPTTDQLVARGFTPERAEWIIRRLDALELEQMRVRFEAERIGEPIPPESAVAVPPVERALRADIGDAEYEQYLSALGRPNRVSVVEIFPDSPAARAGLRAGDRIVAYGGVRLFDLRELNPLIDQQAPAQTVVIDVERNGLPVQVIVPAGPLGIRIMGESG